MDIDELDGALRFFSRIAALSEDSKKSLEDPASRYITDLLSD